MTFTSPGNLTIMGIGGCGTHLVHKICEHDWFLRLYLSGNDRLRIFTVDTATSEKERDQRFFVEKSTDSEEIKKEIPVPLQKHLESIRRPGDVAGIEMGHYHLPDLAGSLSLPRLCDENIANSIKRVTQGNNLSPVSVWWMHDPQHGIYANELRQQYPALNQGFNGGVYRLRAASKAVLYKVFSEHAHNFIHIQPDENVAIVVGLGGGTGSGMLLDLIKYVQKTAMRVWVYAILPSSLEPETERLNAAIALTELEYMSIHHPEFSNVSIIVSSLDNTKYSGQVTGNKNYLEDFDNAFPYTFINGIYMGGENLTAIRDAERHYAKFVFANSAVVEYEYEAINALKRIFGETGKNTQSVIDAYTAVLEKKKSLLALTKNLYSDNAVYSSEYNYEHDRTVTLTDGDEYKEAISLLRRFCETANALDYESGKTFIRLDTRTTSLLSLDFGEPQYFDILYSYVRDMARLVETANPRLQDTVDITCWSLISTSLQYLKELGGFTQDDALIIENEYVRSAHMKVIQGIVDTADLKRSIDHEINGLLAELSQFDKKISEFETQKTELERNKGGVQETVINSTSSPTITTAIRDYLEHESRRGTIEKLEKDFIIHMTTKVEKMEEKLQTARNAKSKKECPKRISEADWMSHPEHTPFIFQAGTYVELAELEMAVTRYYRHAYMIAVAVHDRGGLLTKPINVDAHRRESITQKQIIARNCENYQKYIRYVDEPFHIEIVPGIFMDKFKNDSDSYLDDMLQPMKDELQLTGPESVHIKEKLAVNTPNDSGEISSLPDRDIFLTTIRTVVEDTIILERYQYDQQILELDEKIRSMEEDRETKSARKIYLEIIYDQLLTGTEGIRDEYAEIRSSMTEVIEKIARKLEKLGEKSAMESPYRLTADAGGDASVLRLFRSDTAMNLSVFDREEDHAAETVRESIKSKLMFLATNTLLRPDTLGLQQFTVTTKDETDTSNKEWSFKSSVWMIGSNSVKLTRSISNENSSVMLKGRAGSIVHNHASGEGVVTIHCHNFALPWDTSVSYFVSAGFLDLISQFAPGGRFREEYADLGKHKFMHHTLGLEQGLIHIRRGDGDPFLFTLNDGAAAAYDEAGWNVAGRETIKELYYEESLSDSIGIVAGGRI